MAHNHKDEELTTHPSGTMCFCDYHAECDGVVVVANPTSGKGLTVVCNTCRVADDLEAVCHRVSRGVEAKAHEGKFRKGE